MKYIAVAIVCSLCLFILGCDVGIVIDGSNDNLNGNLNDYTYTSTFETSNSTAGLQSIEVTTTNGMITISGYEGNIIQIDGTKKAAHEADLEKIDLQSKQEGNKLIYTVVHDDESQKAIDLDMLIPIDIIVNLVSSVNGSIDISNVDSMLKTSTVNGGINVEIRSIDNGDIDISSNNGEVSVYILESLDATVYAATNLGKIYLNDLTLILSMNTAKRKEGNLGIGGTLIDIRTNLSDIQLYELYE